MKWFDKLVQRKVDEALEAKNLISRPNGGISVKENIETVMVQNEFLARMLRQAAEDCLTKTQKFNRTADIWFDTAYPFEISLEKTLEKTVPAGCGATIYAVKFLGGDGYGKYDLVLNGIKRSWFTKRKKGNEDGVILVSRLLFLQENDRLEVVQTYGEGELKASLYLFVADKHAHMGW